MNPDETEPVDPPAAPIEAPDDGDDATAVDRTRQRCLRSPARGEHDPAIVDFVAASEERRGIARLARTKAALPARWVAERVVHEQHAADEPRRAEQELRLAYALVRHPADARLIKVLLSASGGSPHVPRPLELLFLRLPRPV
jgi:hypothetical protein